MLTVVDDMNPGVPSCWEDAAKICVSQIFDCIEGPLEHLNKYEDSLISEMADTADREELGLILEALHMLDIQFEGMVNCSNWFETDQMYWLQEWTTLGALGAAAGIKNGNLAIKVAVPGHPEFGQSASAEVFDNWMLREGVTQTLVRKQTDYGHENIARFGRKGLLVRTHDKIARLKNLHLARRGAAANEALSDTYLDIVGYSAIGMMWEREWFLLPLSS